MGKKKIVEIGVFEGVNSDAFRYNVGSSLDRIDSS
jgi:hypothetical protein